MKAKLNFSDTLLCRSGLSCFAVLASCAFCFLPTESFADDSAAAGKPYIVMQRGGIRAVIVNNEAAPEDDHILPGHRAGYSGLGSLMELDHWQNLFVANSGGLNFEHIHDGTNPSERDIFFEPRRAPMQIRRINEFTVELYQAPTPTWKLESWLKYELLPDGAIEMTLECIPRERVFKNGYIGLFFASYISQPQSLDIHFLGWPEEQTQGKPQWIQAATPEHGVLATHQGLNDNREFTHDPNLGIKLVFNFSKYRFSEPWYFGVSNNMAFVQMFREIDQVRFSQSPNSGGKSKNPAWDFQWFIPDYEVGKKYTFVMRAMFLPFRSHEQIIQATARHRAALNPK
jgi:hypothetical protein